MAHKPAGLPLADNVRFTEDTVEMKLRESPLWRNASRLRPYRLDILDTRQGVAAAQAIVEEAGAPVMLMLRLKISGRKISEVDTQVTRSETEGLLFNIEALKAPSGATPRSLTTGNSLIVWEAFKVYGGQIHAVESFMKNMPLGTPSGWDSPGGK